MAYKFFYLYLLAGVLALLLATYHVFFQYPGPVSPAAYLYFVPGVLLLYLAYKAYHEKTDRELM